MFTFFKNIFNAIIIAFAFIGILKLHEQHAFDDIIANINDFITTRKEQTTKEIGDFSDINPEFCVGSAVNLLGFKTIVTEHPASGQKMIILDTGKKQLITSDDLYDDGLKEKLEELCKKFKYNSTTVENIEIIENGEMYTYNRKVPYAKFNAKISKFPLSNVSGIVCVVEHDINNQKILISINEKRKYSQLITTEFFKNVKDAK